MGCELRVKPCKTKDGRSICGKGGRFYTVAGGVGNLMLFGCKYHSRKLERIGLTVIPVTELEALAFRAEAERRKISCSHCEEDPLTCPIEAHAIAARQREIRTA